MNITKKQFPAYFLLILFIFAFAFWALNSGSKQVNEPVLVDQVIEDPQLLDEAEKAEKTGRKFQLFYTVNNKNSTRVYQVTSSQTSKMIYTDSDENTKMLSSYGILDNNLVLLESTQEGYYSLIMVDAIGSGKRTVYSKDIFSVNPPEFSIITKQILTTSFSNAEEDFGFTLFIQNHDKNNQRKIFTSPTNIIKARFSHDGSMIAFIVTAGQRGSKVITYDTASDNVKEILSSQLNIFDLAWNQSGIILSASPQGSQNSNQAEIYQIVNEKPELQKLTENSVCEKHLFAFDNDRQLFYISSEEVQGIISETPGKVHSLIEKIDIGELNASNIIHFEYE